MFFEQQLWKIFARLYLSTGSLVLIIMLPSALDAYAGVLNYINIRGSVDARLQERWVQ